MLCRGKRTKSKPLQRGMYVPVSCSAALNSEECNVHCLALLSHLERQSMTERTVWRLDALSDKSLRTSNCCALDVPQVSGLGNQKWFQVYVVVMGCISFFLAVTSLL